MAVGHVLLLVCMFGLSRAQLLEWTAKTYPNPQTDPELCGRRAGVPSYVCDPNKLLKPLDAEILDHYLVNMPNITKCPCSTYSCELGGPNRGYKLAVALVKKLKKPENMPETVDGKMGLTRSFAFNLLHKYWTWGTCNELSIIVFSQDDGILMTFTGNTTGVVLKDSVTYAVQSELARFFQNKDNVGQGLHYVSLNYSMPETVDGKMGLTRSFAFNLLHKYWTWGTCNELSIIVFSQDDGILMTFTGNTTGVVLKDSVTYAVQSELARFFQNKDNVGQGLHYVSLNYRKVLDGEPVFPITYSEVGSTATMVKVSIVTSLITTVLLRIFC